MIRGFDYLEFGLQWLSDGSGRGIPHVADYFFGDHYPMKFGGRHLYTIRALSLAKPRLGSSGARSCTVWGLFNKFEIFPNKALWADRFLGGIGVIRLEFLKRPARAFGAACSQRLHNGDLRLRDLQLADERAHLLRMVTRTISDDNGFRGELWANNK